MVQNPQWPVLDYAISWPNGPQQSCQQGAWCSIKERTEGQFSFTRGKQYELDQVQPAIGNLALRNDDGAFDSDNTAGPYWPNIKPYRLFRARAQWPPTQNLLTQNQATAGEATALPYPVEQPIPSGPVPASAFVTSTWPLTVASSGSAFAGSHVFSVAVPGSQAATLPYVAVISGMSVVGGQPYSITFHARCTTTGANPVVRAAFVWLDASGNASFGTFSANVTLTGSPTAAWSAITVSTASAPANAAGLQMVLWENTTGPAPAHTVQFDGNQFENAAAPTTYTAPGTWYPLLTAYVERWPQDWSAAGNYGVVNLTITDLFANLAGRKLPAPFLVDLLALNPNFLYPLDEANGTRIFADATGKRGLAAVSPALSYAAAPGSPVASSDNVPQGPDQASALTGAFLGGPGPVVHATQPSAATLANGAVADGILIPPDPATGLIGPPQSGGFTRLIAARVTALPSTGDAAAWQFRNLISATLDDFDISVSSPTPASFMSATSIGAAASSGALYPLSNISPASSTVVTDSDWHLYGASLSSDGKTLSAWCDMSTTPVTSVTGSSARPTGCSVGQGGDSIGGLSSAAGFYFQWNGDLAFACELPFEMTGATWLALATCWRNAWGSSGEFAETSDSRYARILTWLNYTGPSRLSAGLCASYGPAVDVAGQLGLGVLQNVVETEAGQHFTGADGAVVFQSRADRYNRTPAVIFGENDAAGEIPYITAGTDKDPTRVGNDAEVTAQYGSALYRQQDAASQADYGDITIARTVNSIDPIELTAAAQNLIYQYRQPLTRLRVINFDPAATGATVPAIWPALLGLELGVCAQWNRRPSGAPAKQINGFVEQIVWRITDDVRATASVQLSNNQLKNGFAKWGSFRWAPDPGAATLNTALSTTSGTTVVIATATGKTFTTASGSYPLDIVVDSEQVTLAGPPGGSTSPQTFTGCTRHVNGTAPATHSAGAVVSLVDAARYAY